MKARYAMVAAAAAVGVWGAFLFARPAHGDPAPAPSVEVVVVKVPVFVFLPVVAVVPVAHADPAPHTGDGTRCPDGSLILDHQYGCTR